MVLSYFENNIHPDSIYNDWGKDYAQSPSGLNAVYELASIGSEAIDPLVKSLLEYSGQELRPLRKNIKEISEAFHPREWNEGAYALQDEAYALGAMGEPALDVLINLLQSEDKWIKINAAFALGEIGEPAVPAIPILIKQLEDDHHQVLRVTLDALACIGGSQRLGPGGFSAAF